MEFNLGIGYIQNNLDYKSKVFPQDSVMKEHRHREQSGFSPQLYPFCVPLSLQLCSEGFGT